MAKAAVFQLVKACLMLYKNAMISRSLLTFALAVSSTQIWAVPFARTGCQTTSYERGMRDLVQRVSIVDGDDRVLIDELAPTLGWTTQRVSNVRKAMGQIFCPGSRSTAFLIGTNITIATVAHTFYNQQGQLKARAGECYFKNYAGQRFSLDIQRGLRVGSTNPHADQDKDWAIVRLGQPVNAEPFAVDESGRSAKQKDLITLSSYQVGMADRFKNDINGHRCTNMEYFPPDRNIDVPTLLTNCDTNHGASGSPAIVEVSGRLVAAGIMAAGGDRDGAYDPANQVATKFTGIDSRIIGEIRGLTQQEVQVAEASL